MSGEDKYRLFLGGDEDAFEGIMCEYFDGLIFFINRYVNDPHTAEDIAIGGNMANTMIFSTTPKEADAMTPI